MKLKSNAVAPLVLTFAMAGVSSLVSSGRCQNGMCLTIPLPAAVFAATQQGPGRGPAGPVRDPELEKQSEKSLEAAWYYFKKKPDKSDPQAAERLNKAIESRLTEILDIHPTFSKIGEVYFLLGEVYYRSNQPEKAAEYLGKVVKDFPDSKFIKDAKKHLDELNAGKADRKS
ncbi:MAG TPA: tetratricopeptide repeat protein [Blastocatellia bacterium]|nr:tetratricopeptide repeat protein [Blastocatellia bacterium]